MPLRQLCTCFSAQIETRDGEVSVQTPHSPSHLSRPPGNSQHSRTTGGAQETITALLQPVASSTVSIKKYSGKLRGPSSSKEGKPTVANAFALPSESYSDEPTAEFQNGLPPISLELANLVDGHNIPSVTFPAPASMPDILEKTSLGAHTLGLQHYNIRSTEVGAAESTLKQNVSNQPCFDAMCAEAPPTGLGACATSGRSISNTAPTAAVYVPLQQVKRDFQLPAAAAAATASGAAVPQPPSPAAAVLSIFTTGYALAGGVGGGGGGRCGGATAGNATVEVCDILAPPAADSHNAGAAGNAASALRGSAPLVPQYNSAPIRPYVNNRTILPYLASRHMSQVAFLQMLHVGDGDGGGGNGSSAQISGGSSSGSVETQLPMRPQLPPPLPLPLPPSLQQHHQLWSVNVSALSREITGLRWIGQGGGGAVFQAVWQGAPVAVKFLLTEGESAALQSKPHVMDALALEGVVSSVLNHPNVVHTFAFQCAHLTEASFAAVDPEGEDGRMDGLMDEQGNRDLFESLLDTIGLYGGSISAVYGGNAQYSSSARRSPALCSSVGGGVGAAAATAAAALVPSRLGLGGAPQSLVRFGSIVEERDDGGGGGDNCASSPASPDSRAEVAAEQQQQMLLVGARDTLQERDGGEGGSSSGGGVGRRKLLAGIGGGGGGLRTRAAAQVAVQAQLQQQQQPLLQQRQQQSPYLSALDSSFHSGEGFGDPESGSSRGWTVRQALQHLKARQGMFMTYIIMEYCDRGSLLSAIRRGIFKMEPTAEQLPTKGLTGGIGVAVDADAAGGGGRFTKRIVLRAILRTARDVAQGMCHLHGHGIIHGDLKPGNVLLRGCRTDRRGFVAMVADFGLSKVTRGDKPLEAHNWSTITVMAPEAIMGRWLKASDVFSYGILLWQLVTSEAVPYNKLSIPQILMGVSQGTLKPEWPSFAHPALVRLGRACLATSPEKRPSFEGVVKVLIKIEKHVRNELRLQRAREAAAVAATAVMT